MEKHYSVLQHKTKDGYEHWVCPICYRQILVSRKPLHKVVTETGNGLVTHIYAFPAEANKPVSIQI